MTNELQTASIGMVSDGRLESDELVEVLCDTLEELNRPNFDRTDFEIGVTGDEIDDQETVAELYDMLDEHAPDYCYFGTVNGADSKLGFWPVSELGERMKEDGVEVVSDLSEIPARNVAVVNCHGNVTYGYVDSEGFHTIWECV